MGGREREERVSEREGRGSPKRIGEGARVKKGMGRKKAREGARGCRSLGGEFWKGRPEGVSGEAGR